MNTMEYEVLMNVFPYFDHIWTDFVHASLMIGTKIVNVFVFLKYNQLIGICLDVIVICL